MYYGPIELKTFKNQYYLSFHFQMSEKEIETCEFEMDLKNFFLRSNQSNDNIISAYRQGLKTGVGNCIFWSQIGSRFGTPGGTPSTRIPRSTPPGNNDGVSKYSSAHEIQ